MPAVKIVIPNSTCPLRFVSIDNGAGVAEHIADQLFQPFVSSKPEGQGLGLALVSKVASAHGGIVEVKSHPGKTKFSLLLPIPQPGPTAYPLETSDEI